MKMELRWNEMAWEIEVLGENPPQRRFVHHKSHMQSPGIEPGSVEPVPMATLLSVAAGSLLLLLVGVCFIVWAIRREKLCFARRGDFRPSDLESEKSDLDSAAGGRKTPGGGAIPAEAMYNTSPSRRPHTITGGNSPEAMKQRQRCINNSSSAANSSSGRKKKQGKDNLYADLQVPTISNNGSTMINQQHSQPAHYFAHQHSSPHRTSDFYSAGHFQPNSFERAEI